MGVGEDGKEIKQMYLGLQINGSQVCGSFMTKRADDFLIDLDGWVGGGGEPTGSLTHRPIIWQFLRGGMSMYGLSLAQRYSV